MAILESNLVKSRSYEELVRLGDHNDRHCNLRPKRNDQKNPRMLGIVTKSDLLAEHYDVVKRAREDEFGIT